MRAEDVRIALRKRYSDSRRYAVAEEVGLQTGFSHRRLDMMVLDCYASNGFRIDGIEVKVSKADLKRELEDPEKHVAFFDVIDYYTLACPKGVADLSLIPPKWGVMQVNGDGEARYLRRPIALHDEVERSVPRGFLASIVRAIQGRDPGSEQLWAERERGYQEGVNDYKRRLSHSEREIEKLEERSAELSELRGKLRLYGLNDDDSLARFEAYQKLPLAWLIPKLEHTSKEMAELAARLGGADAGKGER